MSEAGETTPAASEVSRTPAIEEGDEDEGLVLRVVVRAMDLRRVLRRQREQALEILLRGVVPRDAEHAHREALRVEPFVTERVLHAEVRVVVRDVGPIEHRVVPDE